MVDIINLTNILLLGVISLGIPAVVYLVKTNKTQFKQGEHLDKLHECDQRIERKLDEHIKEAEKVDTEVRTRLDRYRNDMDKIITTFQTEFRVMGSKIDIMSEKINESEKIHSEFKQEVKDTRHFFTDWNQRIEDLLRDERNVIRRTRTKRSNIDSG